MARSGGLPPRVEGYASDVAYQDCTSISFLCLLSWDSPSMPSSLSPPVARLNSFSVNSILPSSLVVVRRSRCDRFGAFRMGLSSFRPLLRRYYHDLGRLA